MLFIPLITPFFTVNNIRISHERKCFTMFCMTGNKHFCEITTDCKTIQVFCLQIW